MKRPGTIMYNSEFLEFKTQIEETTGYTCYEVNPGDQQTWYGTSDKLAELKTALEESGILNTGTIIFVMDTTKKYMYSAYKEAWYEL